MCTEYDCCSLFLLLIAIKDEVNQNHLIISHIYVSKQNLRFTIILTLIKIKHQQGVLNSSPYKLQCTEYKLNSRHFEIAKTPFKL